MERVQETNGENDGWEVGIKDVGCVTYMNQVPTMNVSIICHNTNYKVIIVTVLRWGRKIRDKGREVGREEEE